MEVVVVRVSRHVVRMGERMNEEKLMRVLSMD